MTGRWDIHAAEGVPFDRTLRWTNAQGQPYDLTGWSGRMHWRTHIRGPLLLTFSTGDGSMVLGGLEGTIRLLQPAETFTGQTWLHGVHDLKLIAPWGAPTRLVAGTVTLDWQVTT
ncbi:hypothetical protein SAMN05421505_12080 [Sinosporangium album]|uniref:Uncharacterized protein n=1 Tax=Sinosporangium album TaxID=504805 RepID=A0A1G8EFZ3_9ACTN|nr:hypothetical protein [Sinosporangium album]SDH68710.1 hypothetical protein SAMN05421505_12080 [Sinosporangium album]